MEYLFDEAVLCSSKSMYPDFLSLSGDGYVPEMYQKYGRIISPMGEQIAHVKRGEPRKLGCLLNV